MASRVEGKPNHDRATDAGPSQAVGIDRGRLAQQDGGDTGLVLGVDATGIAVLLGRGRGGAEDEAQVDDDCTPRTRSHIGLPAPH